MNRPHLFRRIASGIKAHKIWTSAVVAAIAIGGYYWYRSASTANAEPQYVLSVAHVGTLRQTVSGSGQVSASNQTDIQSSVSGTILSINVKVGDLVRKGQLIATVDSKNAAISLQNAKLSLAKLTEPAKATDISNATNALNKSYNDAFDAASSAYLDLPAIMSGLKDLLYGRSGFLSDQRSTYISSTGRTYRDTAAAAYDAAVIQYTASLNEYKGLSRTSSKDSISAMLAHTYTTMKDVADAATKAQNAITFITTYQPDYYSADAATAAASVKTWAEQANSDVTSVMNAQNSISSAKNSLTVLQNGSDALDIQSAQLNLQQAQQTYDNYFIRAPYDGIIGRIPVNVYGQAGASTVMATIVGEQKIATISLNEVDAAKVKVGQPVAITFDAIDNFNATGTVEQVDQVGAVTQGVVSYGVKIAINTADERIKPGMSVNTSITTNQKDDVLLVPSAAIKKQGNVSYVQTFDRSVLAQLQTSSNSTGAQSGTSSYRQYQASSTIRASASTTRIFASSSGTFSASAALNRTMTISSATAPQQMIVTVGESDDTNTVILSGLTQGQLVVTRTIASGAATTATTPSILNALGGNRAAGGTVRTGGNATFIRPGN